MGWKNVLAWGALCAGMASCGDAGEAKTKAQEAILEQAILGTLDDDSTFSATIAQSPLQLKQFEGKLSVVKFTPPPENDMGAGFTIDITSGNSSLKVGPDAINIAQGVTIQIKGWHGEEIIPVVNPGEEPADGSVYAIVNYHEVRRDNANKAENRDWETYRSTEGVVQLPLAENENGGVRGSVAFSILMIEPEKPLPDLELLPRVYFSGAFNIHPSTASEMILGK